MRQTPDLCLSAEEIGQFLRGQVDEAQIERIGDHLAQCERCAQAAADLDRDDDALKRVRLGPRFSSCTDVPGRQFALHSADMVTRRGTKTCATPRGMEKSSADDLPLVTPVMRQPPVGTYARIRARYRRIRIPQWIVGSFSSAVAHAVLLVSLAFMAFPIIRLRPPAITVTMESFQAGSGGTQSIEHAEVAQLDAPNESVGLNDVFADSFGANDAFRISPPIHFLPPEDGPEIRTTEPLRSLDQQRRGRRQPDGHPGQPRQLVASYDEALHRLTEDLLRMLESSDLLLVWLFDRSGSMEDDRSQLVSLLERIYRELGAHGKTSNDAVLTAVASFSVGIEEHGHRPTADPHEVLARMQSIGYDNTGIENISTAVLQLANHYGPIARIQRRRMVLIVLTDEAGEAEDHQRWLEPAIEATRRNRIPVYIFGREAVFGLHMAFVSWHDPAVRKSRAIAITRGPESAGLEQLQIDVFGTRMDAQPSGFGPYAQCRLVRESGGIFFLMAGEEANLLRHTDARYALEAVRDYEPSLASFSEYMADVQSRPIARLVQTIVAEFHLGDPEKAAITMLDRAFPPRIEEFRPEAALAVAHARQLATRFRQRLRQLDQMEAFRDDEPLRWQANYDLLRAQLALFDVHSHQYVLALQQFLSDPPRVPYRREDQRLIEWQVYTRPEAIADPTTQDARQRARQLLEVVVKAHPGTPWAVRAQADLDRGMGIGVRPIYDGLAAEYKPEIEPARL